MKSRSLVTTLAQSRCARGRPHHESTRKPVNLALELEAGILSWTLRAGQTLGSLCGIPLNATVNLVNGCSQCPISRRFSYPRLRPWLWSLNSNSSSATDHSLTRQRFLSCRRGRTTPGTVQHSTSLCRQGYPASAVLMELACYLKGMSIKALVEWGTKRGQQGSRRARKTVIVIVSIHHFAYLSSQVRCDRTFYMGPYRWAKQRRDTARTRHVSAGTKGEGQRTDCVSRILEESEIVSCKQLHCTFSIVKTRTLNRD